MIKRAAGYDRDRGDWVCFYAHAATLFITGKLPGGASCHCKAKADDCARELAE